MEAYDDKALVQQYAALRARFDSFSQVGDPAMDTPDLFGAFIEQRLTAGCDTLRAGLVDQLHAFALDGVRDVPDARQRVDLRG